jgi:GT2 family glycosyltransferase
VADVSSLVIAVNYKTDEHAVQLARSFAHYQDECVHVLLVDNSERDDPDAFARRIHAVNPDVECVAAPSNLGYFGGASFGLKKYLARLALPEWVIICNVDIEFRDPSFFSTLHKSNLPDSVGVIGPQIWSATYQRDVNPKIKQRPTKRRMLFYRIVFGNFYLQGVYELLSVAKYWMKKQFRNLRNGEGKAGADLPASANAMIYAAHGSCMILNRRYFLAGGTVDYPVFLFGEEIFVAETSRQLGLSTIHFPRLWVFDREHASTKGALRSRKVAGYMNEATQYLLQRYFA